MAEIDTGGTRFVVVRRRPVNRTRIGRAIRDRTDYAGRLEQGAAADFADASYAAAATDDWQRERAAALTAALLRNGVTIWDGDLPPSLTATPT